MHASNCTVPIIVVAAVASSVATVTNATVRVIVAIVSTTAGTGKNDVVVLTDVTDCGDCPSSCWFLGAGTIIRFDDLVGDQVFWVSLFTTIHYVFWKMQPSSRRPANYGVMSRWCVSHFHCTEL